MGKMLIVAGLCGLVGMAAGYSWAEDPQVGALGGLFAGLVVGLPMGRAAQTGLRRWVAIAGLHLLLISNLFLVWSASTARIAAVSTLLAVFAIAVTYFIAAAIQRDLYGGSEWDAFNALFSMALGITRDYHIIEDGRTSLPSDARGPVMGPRLVIIKPDNAAVFEMGPKQTQIKGPGVAKTRAYEYVKSIYDLKEQSMALQLDGVLTRDMMTTTVRLKVMYRIDVSLESRTGQRKALTPDEIGIIQQIHSSTTDWKETTRDAIEACVRQAIAGMNLRDTLSPAGSRRIEEDVRHLSNRMLDEWCITVHRLIAEEVRPSSPVMSTTERQWIAAVETNTTVETERARAAAWRDALALLADSYQRAEAMGMSEVAIHSEAVRRTLEQVAKDPATKFILTPELSAALSSAP